MDGAREEWRQEDGEGDGGEGGGDWGKSIDGL